MLRRNNMTLVFGQDPYIHMSNRGWLSLYQFLAAAATQMSPSEKKTIYSLNLNPLVYRF